VPEPYLSIVCAFGHAQRASSWLKQTRHFLSATAIQAERHNLRLEIILVDRDSAGEGTVAADLLGDLPGNAFAEIRIISIPGAEILNGCVIDRERRLQNIGIRRSRGEFVLATGTDTILSEALVELIASSALRGHATYHALRIETAPVYLDREALDSLDTELQCRRGAYCASLPPARVGMDGVAAAVSKASWRETMQRACVELLPEHTVQTRGFSLGDFLLMSRQNWFDIGGFPEWNLGDAYFDRIVLAQARHRGWETVVLPGDCHYFAITCLRVPPIDRDIYVDSDGDVRIRIEPPPIRHFDNWHSAGLIGLLAKALPLPPAGRPVELRVNSPDWGLAGFNLPEIGAFGSGRFDGAAAYGH
jgi:hypothetical protein